MSTTPLARGARPRVGVVGVGHLGKHHARLLQGLDCELVGVADPSEAARDYARSTWNVAAYADYRELLGKVDAVSVVVPTKLHREVASVFLEHGVDVLVEKPIARTSADGQALVELAERHGRVLQVGHVERFNPTLRGIASIGAQARYIESHRLAPFSFRSTDIGVVLDLMIHDLDLVLALVKSEIVSVDAFGGAVFTPAEDMASAIIKFQNGAVAHLTANRVALKPMRKMRVFSQAGYASLDFQTAQGMVVKKAPGWDFGQLDLERLDRAQMGDLWKFVFDGLLQVENIQLDSGNPLQEELADFLRCVRDRGTPIVSGRDGTAAVAAAERVLAAIARNRWQ
ncbi:MAG: Gfo/Idh/MocA family oxidoreductase [Planctomycetes bacterium]|jgi:predicted dehydrogenase|nr:Gfo/Idh/MocA family oxidoreductase [Planctomycetota bacterium]